MIEINLDDIDETGMPAEIFAAKRKKKKNPNERVLVELRKQGHLAASVEKWVTCPGHPGGGIRRDLFGCIDILAIRNGKFLGIQTTSGAHHADHIAKMFGDADIKRAISLWLQAGGEIEIWSYTKKQVNGKPKWVCRIEKLGFKPTTKED